MQGIFPLSGSKAGVRLTTAKFFSPNGYPYAGVGVEPQVVVHQTAKPIPGAARGAASPQQDPVLTAALPGRPRTGGQPVITASPAEFIPPRSPAG